jgi:hypothetical protein
MARPHRFGDGSVYACLVAQQQQVIQRDGENLFILPLAM